MSHLNIEIRTDDALFELFRNELSNEEIVRILRTIADTLEQPGESGEISGLRDKMPF